MPLTACKLMLGVNDHEKRDVALMQMKILQGSTNRRAPGCENAAGKLRQKW